MDDPATQNLSRRGRCHVLGDDVSLDDDIIPAQLSAERVLDPDQLVPYLFANLDPGLAARMRPGDIVLAGRNFACGKPRVQGFIAMAHLQLSVVCGSMSYKMLRRAVARGIPVITGAAETAAIAASGDEIEVDFGTGAIRNYSNGKNADAAAMPRILRDIVAAGGARAMLAAWLADHPEQAGEHPDRGR